MLVWVNTKGSLKYRSLFIFYTQKQIKMGVDIYGRNPQINSEKPELVPESASEQEKAEYFQALDKWDVAVSYTHLTLPTKRIV